MDVDPSILTGFEDETTRNLKIATAYLRKSGVPSLAPMLPVLLSLKGKPYTLQKHFPFEPFFRTRVPKSSVLICGRQLSKSTSLAAQGIVQANSIPYFSTLFVTPLFEQIRRFSQNYVARFIEESPVRNLFISSKSIGNVLQRTFHNRSTMLFSYAFLDAERTRGFSADVNAIDECIKIGTYVYSSVGCAKPVEAFKPGDEVLSFNEKGQIEKDEVVDCYDRGWKDCYKLKFSDGTEVDTTSNARIATTQGWRRVEQIVADCFAGANVARNDAGRRCNALGRENVQRESRLQKQSRLQATQIQLPKIPGIVRIGAQASQEETERRLRKMVKLLGYQKLSGITSYRFLVSPSWKEERHSSLAGSSHLGGNRLVDNGRRLSRPFDNFVPYRGVFSQRGQTDSALVTESRCDYDDGSTERTARRQKVLLSVENQSGLGLLFGGQGSPVHLSGDELQDRFTGEENGSDVLLVRRPFRSEIKKVTIRSNKKTRLLRRSVLSENCARGKQQKVHTETRNSRSSKAARSRALQEQSGEVPSFGAGIPKKTSRENQSQKTTLFSGASADSSNIGVDLSALWAQRTSRASRPENTLLSALSSNSYFGDEAGLREAKKGCSSRKEQEHQGSLYDLRKTLPRESGFRCNINSLRREMSQRAAELSSAIEDEKPRLVPVDLVSIEWTGVHRVFDLETKRNNTFFSNGLAVHNCQDLDHSLLQIIHETMSASDWGLKRYSGTPKSLDNSIERLWIDSSQAEWVIRCRTAGCRHWNVPALDWDLLDMIGPWHADISEEIPGVVCAKCRKPLAPRSGRWVHAFPDRRWATAGYHVPQFVMPMHYADPEKWDSLLGKMMGRAQTTFTTFLNEVCGESYDVGSKLVTESDLKNAACLPWPNKAKEAVKHLKKYTRRILAVDWGGGGGALKKTAAKKGGEVQRLRTSFTSMAVLGMCPDGKVDVIWGHRSIRTHDWEYEARLCLEAMSVFKCEKIVHDYSNAGEGRLILMYQAGLPVSSIINMTYQGVGHNIINYHPPSEDNPHAWYSVDKSRSLATTCMCLKYGLLRFFEYDFISNEEPGVMKDFLALLEEKLDSRIGTDVYVIVRNPNLADDFAQAVNIGCCALWTLTKKWPNVAEAARFTIPRQVLKRVNPVGKVDWNAI